MKRWIHGSEYAEYAGPHQPSSHIDYPDEVASAYNITDPNYFPSDILDKPYLYFPNLNDYSDSRRMIQMLKQIQGKPDAIVTIYRGAPSGGVLHTGNWVTPSFDYVKDYAGEGMNSGNKDSKIYSYRVKARDLSFDGDSIFEFGYWGKPITGQEENF